MSLKIEFVSRATKPGAEIAGLCREYGISRETGYKWLRRFKELGPDGLEEQSRRPNQTPLATAEDLVLAVLELRDSYPRRGPKKLFHLLARRFGKKTPSIPTIARILKRFGYVRQRSKFRRLNVVGKAPRAVASRPNEIWTIDYKGWWRVADGQRCEPLTVRDAYSRYILAIRVMKTPVLEEARVVMVSLFSKYGLPERIQCDNGGPFVNVSAKGGLTRLSAWWIKLGIGLIRSRPACPQDNGGHERMHLDIAQDVQAYPADSLRGEQRACDLFRQEFNHVRPHEALGGKVPADLYKPSERRPRKTAWIYPPDWIVRRVDAKGNINVKSLKLTASKCVVGENVGLEPIAELEYRLWFRNHDLGTVKLAIPDDVIDEASETYMKKQKREA